MYLITYWHGNHKHLDPGFSYDIAAKSVEEWIDEFRAVRMSNKELVEELKAAKGCGYSRLIMQRYDDGDYILINALPISDEQAKKWDSALQSM